MAHLDKDSGGGNTKKNPYTPGSWDWIQYQNKLAFQDRLKAQLDAKKESSPAPQESPQPGPPPNTPAPGPSPTPPPSPIPGPSPAPSPSVPGLPTTPSPIPEPKESGIRNTVSHAPDTIADFKEALKNDDIETMRSKAEEFFSEDPKFAGYIPYNNQYDLILMDDQFHVIEKGKGIARSSDALDDALKYVGWTGSDETDGNSLTEDFYEDDYHDNEDIGNTEVINNAIKGVSGNETIVRGQGYLTATGFPIGTSGINNNGVDGKWGDMGKASTKLFQQMMELPQTGELDDTTLAKMKECTNSGLTFKQLVMNAYNNGVRPEIVKDSTQAERVNTIYFYALLDEDSSGVPAAITVAQAIQESSAGSRIPTDKNDGTFSYNMFGIKAGKSWLNNGGAYVITDTWEEVNGEKIKVEAKFRAYDSYLESVNDHSRFLTDISRYKSLFGIHRDDAYLSNWAKGLENAGYATDSNYAEALESHIARYGLK